MRSVLKNGEILHSTQWSVMKHYWILSEDNSEAIRAYIVELSHAAPRE